MYIYIYISMCVHIYIHMYVHKKTFIYMYGALDLYTASSVSPRRVLHQTRHNLFDKAYAYTYIMTHYMCGRTQSQM